jgi:hypothetical protein
MGGFQGLRAHLARGDSGRETGAVLTPVAGAGCPLRELPVRVPPLSGTIVLMPTGFVKASFDYKNLPFNGTVDANGQISWRSATRSTTPSQRFAKPSGPRRASV